MRFFLLSVKFPESNEKKKATKKKRNESHWCQVHVSTHKRIEKLKKCAEMRGSDLDVNTEIKKRETLLQNVANFNRTCGSNTFTGITFNCWITAIPNVVEYVPCCRLNSYLRRTDWYVQPFAVVLIRFWNRIKATIPFDVVSDKWLSAPDRYESHNERETSCMSSTHNRDAKLSKRNYSTTQLFDLVRVQVVHRNWKWARFHTVVGRHMKMQ